MSQEKKCVSCLYLYVGDRLAMLSNPCFSILFPSLNTSYNPYTLKCYISDVFSCIIDIEQGTRSQP